MNLALVKTRSAALTQVEKNRRLVLVAAAYGTPENADKLFQRIPGIEGLNDEQRRATSTTGTLMQPAVDALNKDGIATSSTLGGIEDNLGLAPDEVHDLACACHGISMTGGYMTSCFGAYKNGD